MNTDYWTKVTEPNYEDIFWNIPEQKTGDVLVLGGNSGAFATEIRNAEFLNSVPVRNVRLLFPDALRGKIPPLPGIDYAPSTDSGSFAKSQIINDAILATNGTLLSGDLSKNSATAIAIIEAIKATTKRAGNKIEAEQTPVVISRDAVDLLTADFAEIIDRPNITLVASMIQLQKIFRSVLYPKMLMLSAPLLNIVETLHKFTLSYPTTILTFHEGNIIIVKEGKILTIALDKTNYTPLSLWAGTLASKILALNLWNGEKKLEATAAALFWDAR